MNRITFLSLLSILLILVTTPLLGQSAENAEGGNALVQEVVSQTPLPSGNVLAKIESRGFTWTNESGHTMGNGSMDCYGSAIMSAEGELLSGAGACTVIDAEGDTWDIWYSGATGGEWGITNGTGKYEGASGGGTWANDQAYVDGKQTNTWTGSWTMQ